MKQAEIIAMATEAGLNSYRIAPSEAVAAWERFAALVAAKEREACAQVCDASVKEWLRLDGSHHELTEAQMLADEIRARGMKEGA